MDLREAVLQFRFLPPRGVRLIANITHHMNNSTEAILWISLGRFLHFSLSCVLATEDSLHLRLLPSLQCLLLILHRPPSLENISFLKNLFIEKLWVATFPAVRFPYIVIKPSEKESVVVL